MKRIKEWLRFRRHRRETVGLPVAPYYVFLTAWHPDDRVDSKRMGE